MTGMEDSLRSHFPGLPQAFYDSVLNAPLGRPPNGTVPNFDNPPNRNVEALAVFICLVCLATAAALGRGYAKLCVARKVQLEDCTYSCSFEAPGPGLAYSEMLI